MIALDRWLASESTGSIGYIERTKLVRKSLQRAQEASEVHLSCRKFAATAIISAVESRGRVDDEKGETSFGHHLGSLSQELYGE